LFLNILVSTHCIYLNRRADATGQRPTENFMQRRIVYSADVGLQIGDPCIGTRPNGSEHPCVYLYPDLTTGTHVTYHIEDDVIDSKRSVVPTHQDNLWSNVHDIMQERTIAPHSTRTVLHRVLTTIHTVADKPSTSLATSGVADPTTVPEEQQQPAMPTTAGRELDEHHQETRTTATTNVAEPNTTVSYEQGSSSMLIRAASEPGAHPHDTQDFVLRNDAGTPIQNRLDHMTPLQITGLFNMLERNANSPTEEGQFSSPTDNATSATIERQFSSTS
jgi:hypothetical protein